MVRYKDQNHGQPFEESSEKNARWNQQSSQQSPPVGALFELCP